MYTQANARNVVHYYESFAVAAQLFPAHCIIFYVYISPSEPRVSGADSLCMLCYMLSNSEMNEV